jgi:hypothetical protein
MRAVMPVRTMRAHPNRTGQAARKQEVLMRRIASIRVRLALGASALAALALPAAAPAAPSCQASGSDITCTFSHTGAAQTWTVPEGITEATFDAYGAAGGTPSGGNPGGLGGRATAAIAVTPGDTLQVNVGGTATRPIFGGFNGGANGGTGWEVHGAGGGGASDVRAGAFTLADRIIVAGGGGGGAGWSYSGTSGGSGGGASRICIIATVTGESATNGSRPARHSYATTPSE